MIIRKSVELKVDLTAGDIARAWCEMDAGEQARFFNAIAKAAADWDKPLGMQLCAVAGEEGLSKAGREVMASIGDHSGLSSMPEGRKEEP